MKNREVVEKFFNGECATGSNLFSTGTKLFSYQTCIAQWYRPYLVINKTRYSVTTSKHLYYLNHIIIPYMLLMYVKEVYNIDRGSNTLPLN